VGYPPDFSGDFNGDGLPDLFMEHDKGVGVWKNIGNLEYEKSPMLKVAADRQENSRVVDLDGDGNSDFIAWNVYDPEKKGKVYIHINNFAKE